MHSKEVEFTSSLFDVVDSDLLMSYAFSKKQIYDIDNEIINKHNTKFSPIYISAMEKYEKYLNVENKNPIYRFIYYRKFNYNDEIKMIQDIKKNLSF